jgi:hypothetical protein
MCLKYRECVYTRTQLIAETKVQGSIAYTLAPLSQAPMMARYCKGQATTVLLDAFCCMRLDDGQPFKCM